jgi:hypothetical protein
MPLLPAAVVFVAVFLRLTGGAGYLVAVMRGRATPNPVTWLCWGLAPLVAFAAQVQDGVGAQDWMTLVLAVGPLAILVMSLAKGRSRWAVSGFDLSCGFLALTGLFGWYVTRSPLVALLFSILADLAGGVPTVLKAYRRPLTEYATPYLLSMISMVVTLLTIPDWSLPSTPSRPTFSLSTQSSFP